MKQLTDTEKLELASKIKDEQEGQQTLGEKYPNPPEKFKRGISDNWIFVKQSLEIRCSLDHSLSSCLLCVYLFQVAEF